MACGVYLVFLVAAVLVLCVDSDIPLITVALGSNGNIRGAVYNRWSNSPDIEVEAFYGIPYALPPIGERRFKRPEPLRNVTNDTINWLSRRRGCLQEVDNATDQNVRIGEDCLYLNIFRPRCTNSTMATVVFIHGGGFLQSDHTTLTTYDGRRRAAEMCVIVAILNYRLGALGFLHVDTPGFDNNVGLYDVALALHFIKNTVSFLSGDPNRITVLGSGAGAFLASAFVFSPYLRDTVNSVILQSGSPPMQMLYQSRASAEESAMRLATNLSCDTTNKQEMVNCLRQVDAHVLMQSFARTIDGDRYRMVTVIDGDIITRSPFDSLRNGHINNVSLMINTNKYKATEAAKTLLLQHSNPHDPLPMLFSDNKINSTLTVFLRKLYNPTHLNYVTTMVKFLYDYEKIKNAGNSSLAFLSPVVQDVVYTCPMRLVLDAYAVAPREVYVYSFNHAPDNSSLTAWGSSTHIADLPYVYGNNIGFSHREYVLNANIKKLLKNFAEYGNPTAGEQVGVDWQRYLQDDEQMLVITEDAQLINGTVQGQRCSFWNTMPAEMKLFF